MTLLIAFFLLTGFLSTALPPTGVPLRPPESEAVFRAGISYGGGFEARGPDTAAERPLRIAIITEKAAAEGTEQNLFIRTLQEEVHSTFEGRAVISFVMVHVSEAAAGGMPELLREVQGAREVDAIVVVGPEGVRAVREQVAFPKPVVAVDPASGLLDQETEEERAAKERATVVHVPHTAMTDLRALAQLALVRRVAVLVDAQAAASYPAMHPSATKAAGALGMTLTTLPVAASVPDALSRLPESADAVYVAPLNGLTADERRSLADSLLARGLPSVVASNSAAVEAGFLVSTNHNGRFVLARRVAVRLRELMRTGTSAALAARASDWSDGTPPQLVVNTATAQALGVELPWSVRLNARLVGQATPSGSVLTLAGAMQESVARNLSLQIDRYGTDASAENIDIARSRLLPQIDVEGRGRLISEEQAEASLGSQPEELYTGTATFRQVLFSEPAFANLSIERRRQAAEAYELDVTRLDAAEGAATAYTRLLRARSQANIQRENLELALANLEAARTRRALGEAGPAEVSRLETTVGQARRRVAEAAGEVKAAEIALNQVLVRPLDAPVRVMETGPEEVLEQFPYAALLGEPMGRQAFKAFWVSEAREQAPEIQAAIRLTSAQERRLRSAERSFFLPEVSLEGSYTQRVDEGGAGSGALNVPSDLSSVITPAPGEQWNVGITVAFPLFRGTERVAQRRQAAEQLRAARTQRDLAAQRVEQSARTAFARLETAYIGAQAAQSAAEAAARSLAVVQASYRQGTASVLDLLDAQSTALVTQVEAADAVYDFEQEWIALQRAAGSFTVLRTPEEEARFEDRFGSLLDASMPDALNDRR